MASSSQSRGRGGSYDVYLSFRGPDIGNTFVAYLDDALRREGICAGLNVEAFRKGEDASLSRFKAIKIAVVIFSKMYASDALCLNDLLEIMERSKHGELEVLPVFYGVDEKEVRTPRKSFARALAIHENELGKDSEKVKRWREALLEVGSLPGLCSKNHRTVIELTRSIIKRINDLLGRAPVDGPRSGEDGQRSSYDVFLSFRGPDCRSTIISHLYPALCQKGLEAFKDNEKLEAGQKRSELFEAIEGSRVAVVMFSENYAVSRWCLDELKIIMERKEMNQLAVIPIFYKVSPREVRLREKENGSKGCYQIAMEEKEAKYGESNPKMVESWKKALWKGGDLIGFSLRHREDEGGLVRKVVENVLKILNRVPLEVAENPVGMTTRLEGIKSLLRVDPHDDDVSMVGILGLGGVGKTTLSKAILKEHFRKFDDWCFLPNIREESRVFNGLALLQQRLLRKLLSQENLTVSSVDEGKVLIKERLRSKTVLIILDDVDKYDQFDALAGDLNWFGKRSRIIITTRDRHMLPSDRVQHVHEVSLLNEDEAENLFRSHAFHGRGENVDISQPLIDRFLACANKLPLALVVLGQFLHDRGAPEWESALEKLDEIPNSDINCVLKISFDGLSMNEKQIFLDIACFFKGWDKEYTIKVLTGCHPATTIGLKILAERCLVIDEGDKFQMHDLIEAMGKSIVRDEYGKAAEISSRIWLYQDFVDVLSKEPVPNAVTGVVVLNSARRQWDELIKGSIFKSLYRLTILIVRSAFHIEGSLHLPSELRWFEWPGLSVSTVVFSDPSKIVAIDMMGSNVERIMGKAFTELKYLNLCNCKSLNALPNLSGSLELEDLNLRGCKNLTRLDDLIGSLEKLVHLDLGDCDNLTEVPGSLESMGFRTLNFSGCSKLDKLPNIKAELRFLHELSLEKTAVEKLPDCIGNLVAVKVLNLNSCEELIIIPNSIYKLRALEKLLARGCSKLEKFPRREVGDATEILPSLVLLDLQYCNFKEMDFLMDLTCFDTLKELRLSANHFAYLPSCISKFEKLEELQLCSCQHLVEVPELTDHAKLYIMGCRELRALPNYVSVIRRSQRSIHVDLSNCRSLDLRNIDKSLSIEMIRDFGGSVEAIVPGEAFPKWMDFQITECCSNYVVPLPEGMPEDDILGLALSVTFKVSANARDEPAVDFLPEVKFMVGNREDVSVSATDPWEGVHTWFVYLPRQPLSEKSEYLAEDIDWSNITFWIKPTGTTLESFGLRVLCKQERDDGKFVVLKKEEKIGAEYD